MSLLDFLTEPRAEYHAARPTSIDLPGGQPEHAMLPPTQTEKPSLLSGIWDYLKSPQNLAAVAAGLKGLGGDDSGVAMAAQLGQQRRQDAMTAKTLAEKKAALKAKNDAFKAAYRPDASGKMRFDPAAYAAALGDSGEADLGEMASLRNSLAPKTGVSGDTPYTQDDEGNTTWGESRPPSEQERQAAARAEEIERHNREMERLGLMRTEAYDYSARRPRVGRGGGGGASVPALPPGFVVEK